MKLRPVIRLCHKWPALLLLITSLPVWARSYHVTRFHSDIHVDGNRSATVTEEFTFAFKGQFQGIYRNIPVEYPGPGGTNYSLFIKVDRMTDENQTYLFVNSLGAMAQITSAAFVSAPRSSSGPRVGAVVVDSAVAAFPAAASAVVEAEHFSLGSNGPVYTLPEQSHRFP